MLPGWRLRCQDENEYDRGEPKHQEGKRCPHNVLVLSYEAGENSSRCAKDDHEQG